MIMCRSASMLLVSTLAAGVAAQTYEMMAGYTPQSNVTEHSQLDLDVAIMETEADKLTEVGFTAAFEIYSQGNNSAKTDSIRTVQGFSTDAAEKLSGEPNFVVWSNYWGADDYADVFTSSACEGTGNFTDASFLTRSEGCLKGAQYQNVWMYVVHELEDALVDCDNGDLDANNANVIAWDEGWAFYTGSLEGTAIGGTPDEGQMLYALAEKRCENFKTCSGDEDGDDLTGTSAVNSDILALWQTGQGYIQDMECSLAETVKDEIVTLMTVPLVQGLLRYTYLADPVASPDTTDKEAAELWAFAAAILPRINACDADVATVVRNNADITLDTAPMSAGYATVKTQLESVYSCMGITCAQVGGLVDEDAGDGSYLADFGVCEDTFAAMAGYTPVSDVSEHAELDLDVAIMETEADKLTEAGFTAAYTIYSEGANSAKTDSIRTVQGFSTDAAEKLSGEPNFVVWSNYWGADDYADVFTSSACEGTGNFTDASFLTRSEGCLKGAQYQNVWMYVVHELEDALNDCDAEDLDANNANVIAWDEGWAFYTGSLEGTAVGGSPDEGQMLYALAEKRCENFKTCSGDEDGDDLTGTSAVNSDILALWQTGQGYIQSLNCTGAETVKDEIVTLMTVPLMQGVLRYTYLADPDASPDTTDKEAAELWAFSAAILPRISDCDAGVATTLRNNADITLDTAPMSAGYATVKTQLESVYSCMGITCAQIGGLVDEDAGDGNYLTGFEPCVDGEAATDVTDGDFAAIAGYTPVSDVSEHAELDLDVATMETEADKLTEAGFTAAYTIYSEGANSEKEDSMRTVQGFSTEASGKLTGETYYDMWVDYWGFGDYADRFTGAACNATGDFADASFLTRSEGCLKGAQYQNVWMYVIHELEDALVDCDAGDLENNDGGVVAWDEGWAFYTGSLEGTAVGGTPDEGQMLYALAEKRCENFKTCSGDEDGDDLTGTSAVNSDILAKWKTGQGYIQDMDCDLARAVKEDIVSLMTVPLVQGVLRYTYLADPDASPDTTDKEAAELWAFSAAILPRISDCDEGVATTLRNNADITLDTAPMSAGYATVKAELESVYVCLGISCTQVGGLVDEDAGDGNYLTGFEPCADDEATTDVTDGDFAAIAGYTPVSDVSEHAELDLDIATMETEADKLTEAGFTAAYTIYSEGANSEKEDSMRTVQGFSTEASGKLTGETYYDMWVDYWGFGDYADRFTGAACNATGDFADASFLTRSEGCLKGAQYQNVWMYVVHELEDALVDCDAGDLENNDGGVVAWDEGWAFYTGSLEGTAVGGTPDEGQMLYALAEKRCENFMTCSGDEDGDDLTGTSAVNSDILAKWKTGQGYIQDMDCDLARAVKEDIVSLMTVPLVQGVLRYTYLADPVASPDTTDKEAAELWAFSAAILPRIDDCDAGVATTLRDNADITRDTAPMSAGYATVKAELESVYVCLGISCAQVGGLIDEDAGDGNYLTGFEPCVDSEEGNSGGDNGDTAVASTGSSDDSGLSGGGVAGVTIAVCAVAVAAIAFFVIRKKRSKSAAAVDDNLGNF